MSAIKTKGIEQKKEEATTSSADGAVNPPEAVWDQERLEAALASLKDMYIQLRELRSTIPRLIEPLTVKQPSPEELYRKFASAALAANEEIKRFRDGMQDEETKLIFERASESRARDPRGITPWRITDEPDWLVRSS
ncbi:MAG: hypothetical protein M1818_004676 [Claussenomyces sp. TS43310]|nr:MAG: hypothetical protein M1818_004676 [Claussenomyces sp. TS43310]